VGKVNSEEGTGKSKGGGKQRREEKGGGDHTASHTVCSVITATAELKFV